MPAAEMGQPAEFAFGKPSARDARYSTNQWAKVFCEEYVLGQLVSTFTGGVYVSHPRMWWLCEHMEVQTPDPGSRTVVAEQRVEFGLADEKGAQKVHGTGDKAVYTLAVTNGPAGRGTNEILHLTGSPAVVETENMTNTSSHITLDLVRHKLVTAGHFQGTITNADTNAFRFPAKTRQK